METASLRMATLTMWFIDGHYIADDSTDSARALEHARNVARLMMAAAKSQFVCDQLPEWTAPRWCEAGSLVGPEALEGIEVNADEALLKAARHLVAKYGYEGATLARICEQSCVKKSSLYWRLKDKDSLVKTAVAGNFKTLLQPFYEIDTNYLECKQGLAGAIQEYLYNVTSAPNTSKAALLLALQRWDPPQPSTLAVRECLEQVESAIADFIAKTELSSEMCEEGASSWAWAMTRLIIGMTTGYVLGDNWLYVDSSLCLSVAELV